MKLDGFHHEGSRNTKALQFGRGGEGAPVDCGNRFYAGCSRDPDGNKLNAFCMTGG